MVFSVRRRRALLKRRDSAVHTLFDYAQRPPEDSGIVSVPSQWWRAPGSSRNESTVRK